MIKVWASGKVVKPQDAYSQDTFIVMFDKPVQIGLMRWDTATLRGHFSNKAARRYANKPVICRALIEEGKFNAEAMVDILLNLE